MGKYERLLLTVLKGVSDCHIAFDDLCNLLRRLGFEERKRSSHHIFRRSGVQARLNLQRDGNKAKPYQVRQVRNAILQYGLADKL